MRAWPAWVQDRDSSVATPAMANYDQPGVTFSREERIGFYGRETATYTAPRRATQYVAPSAP